MSHVFGLKCDSRGIKTMKECLPAQLLKEKLPRFLQKCTQTFESDRRYKNDLRYIRVWLQLVTGEKHHFSYVHVVVAHFFETNSALIGLNLILQSS